MLPLSAAWTCEKGLPLEARIPKLWDTTVFGTNGVFTNIVSSFLPQDGAKGTSFKCRVLRKCLLSHRQVRKARVWVEVEVRGHRPTLQGTMGVFTQ